MPKIRYLVVAFGLDYDVLRTHAELPKILPKILPSPEHFLVEAIIGQDNLLLSKFSSKRKDDGSMESLPLDDMEPLLPHQELAVLSRSCRQDLLKVCI